MGNAQSLKYCCIQVLELVFSDNCSHSSVAVDCPGGSSSTWQQGLLGMSRRGSTVTGKPPGCRDGLPAHKELWQTHLSLSHHWKPGKTSQNDENRYASMFLSAAFYSTFLETLALACDGKLFRCWASFLIGGLNTFGFRKVVYFSAYLTN